MTTTEVHTRQPVRAEQTRARYPDESGYVERDGVKLYWEVYGSGEQTVFLLPTWSIIHSRHWKMQIPYLARHCRVLTFDGRGNGRSDRPESGYEASEFAADALAVMDATATDRAMLVSLSLGAQRALLLAAEHPERVDGSVFICPTVPLSEPPKARATVQRWDKELDTDEGWAKYNRHYWLRDYRGFLEFFFSQMFPEPHSTKPIEDCVGWGLETDAQTLIATQLAESMGPDEVRDLAGRVRCPVLVIQGSEDRIAGPSRGVALAEATGGELVMLEGSGHGPHVRDPVKVNLLLREFALPSRAGSTLGARQSAPEAGALRLVSDRPRPCAARRSDCGRASQAAPGPRDRLARPTPGHEGAGGARRTDSSRERAAGERVGSHRERVGRARPALLSGDPADGRDPARQLHGLPRPGARARLRPLDRRRGLGARLLPTREPRAEERRLRVADGLRRLAADGGRRRSRVVPDRRLQRGNDRAHRALPASARPRGVRRQRRTTSSRRTSGPTCHRSASGRRSTTTSRAT